MATILFDLFGTLVSYSASRTEQGYPRSAAVLALAGCTLSADTWLGRWAGIGEALDQEAEATGIEFSMADAYRLFAPTAGLDPDDEHVAAEFLRTYLDEWSAPVRVVDGAPAMLERLAAAGHRNVLVSNTHDADMVRRHLQAGGLLPHLTAVVTSVEIGFRKPRPEIYAAALDPLGVAAEDAVFVGDTLRADYVGPTTFGIESYLIVPDGDAHPDGLPLDRRLATVLDLEGRIRG
jgi:putative hydrolase of the HAD superfamily